MATTMNESDDGDGVGREREGPSGGRERGRENRDLLSAGNGLVCFFLK